MYDPGCWVMGKLLKHNCAMYFACDKAMAKAAPCTVFKLQLAVWQWLSA